MEVEIDHRLTDERIDQVHAWLQADAWWAAGRSLDLQRRAMQASLNFFALSGGGLVGYARVLTDGATFSYLSDVYVPAALRGNGISRTLMQSIMQHEVSSVRLFGLKTSSAHGLYKKFGFEEPGPQAASWMQVLKQPAITGNTP
jgi:GNAT superfamily N-acetyltransferase